MQRGPVRRWPSIRWIMRSACKRQRSKAGDHQILNTQEHHDHTAGTARWCAKPAPRILAHQECARQDSHMARGLGAGDVVKSRQDGGARGVIRPATHESRVACFRIPISRRFFVATRCQCRRRHCPPTVVTRSSSTRHSRATRQLAPTTLIYPGHDYIQNNLRFTLNREPDNRRAAEMLEQLATQDRTNAYVSTLAVESQINTFLRLTSPTVIAKLRETFPDLPVSTRSAHRVLEVARTAQQVVNAWGGGPL